MSIHVEPRGLVEASVVHILVIGDEKIQWPCGGLQFGSPVDHMDYGLTAFQNGCLSHQARAWFGPGLTEIEMFRETAPNNVEGRRKSGNRIIGPLPLGH